MKIKVNDIVSLELINLSHSNGIFEMIDQNRVHLRQWLDFVDKMQSPEFVQAFVKETCKKNSNGSEYAFVILKDGNMIGRVGIYKIDKEVKTGEMGFWLVQSAQGKGIVTLSCKKLIDFCFQYLKLENIQLKCGVDNHKSNAVAKRLKFTYQNILPQAEWINNRFVDLNLYALQKN